MKRPYDYLIVGAGLFGSVFAYEAKKRGKCCLVVDRRDHIGGNTYLEDRGGINVHKYGAHIFHTNSEKIWDYVCRFTPFNNYINAPLAFYRGHLYNLPFNMNTFYQLWGTQCPLKAKKKIVEQTVRYKHSPRNLKEQALSLVGKDIYEIFIKGYTTKQWGKDPGELPAFIIKRIPLRFTFDNNYYNHRYQGIPIGGYNKIIQKMLEGTHVHLNADFFKEKTALESQASKVVFTGKIDEFYGYKLGFLEYRSLHFEHENLNRDNYQGNAVVNYTDTEPDFTRIIEHKHFEFGKGENTIITREYPRAYSVNQEAYYPINDQKNNRLYSSYEEMSKKDTHVIFGGRLAQYKYYDMDQVIASSLNAVKKEFNEP